jgi:hypothetical protein
MATFLYRCPNTRQHVQGWIADDPNDLSDDTYETVICTACARLHLVNPKTGRILAADKN